VVAGLSSGVTSVTTGYQRSRALTTSGGIRCWANNVSGQLGAGSTCAISAAGVVFCWGDNTAGQLGNTSGNGDFAGPDQPASTIADLTGVKEVAVRSRRSCALLSTGAVTCWGMSEGPTTPHQPLHDTHPTPTLVPGVLNATAITAGNNHMCAILVDGTVSCWGSNLVGESGRVLCWGDSSPSPTYVALAPARCWGTPGCRAGEWPLRPSSCRV